MTSPLRRKRPITAPNTRRATIIDPRAARVRAKGWLLVAVVCGAVSGSRAWAADAGAETPSQTQWQARGTKSSTSPRATHRDSSVPRAAERSGGAQSLAWRALGSRTPTPVPQSQPIEREQIAEEAVATPPSLEQTEPGKISLGRDMHSRKVVELRLPRPRRRLLPANLRGALAACRPWHRARRSATP